MRTPLLLQVPIVTGFIIHLPTTLDNIFLCFFCSLFRYENVYVIWFAESSLPYSQNQSCIFQFVQGTLNCHLTPGEFSGKLPDRKIYKQDSVLILQLFVSMASNILQYITFAVLLTGSPASAFGNGIQGGSSVSDVINSYSIFLFLPSFCVLF